MSGNSVDSLLGDRVVIITNKRSEKFLRNTEKTKQIMLVLQIQKKNIWQCPQGEVTNTIIIAIINESVIKIINNNLTLLIIH